MSFDKQYALKVLSFWLQTEFFNTLDLKRLLPGGDDGALQFTTKELQNDPRSLPWFTRQRIRLAGDKYDPKQQYSYTLYLGLFNRNEFAKQANAYFQSFLDPSVIDTCNDEDWHQRRDDNGITCCAKIRLNCKAELQLNTLEMSTAPWALGKLLSGKIDELNKDDFDEDVQKFKDRLYQIHMLASNLKKEHEISLAFTSFELFEILKLLSSWAGFIPSETRFSLVVQLKKEPKESSPVPTLLLPDKITDQFRSFPALIKNTEIAVIASDEPETNIEELSDNKDIPILNSFFVDDIAKAIRLINNEKLDMNSPLAAFLLADPYHNVDLFTKGGEAIVKEKLAINNTPLGRWPEDPAHTMGLMQQFSINNIGKHLCVGGLYSVNGPPGTGKTTMLRDIIADNMVKRAKVLAGLKSASEAFAGNIKIKVGDTVAEIKELIPALTGYEMLVVSSNNTAVENITKELPQVKALGNEFRKLSYLKPVAQKVAAQVMGKNKPKHLIGLNENEDCWGLIAAALGNSANRYKFCNKVFFEKTSKMKSDDISSKYSTLVDAIKAIAENNDTKKEFSIAQSSYLKGEKEVNKALLDLQRLEVIELDKRKLEIMKIECSRREYLYIKRLPNLAKLNRKCLPWWHYQIIKGCKRRAIKNAYSALVEQKKLEFEKFNCKYNLFSEKLEQEILDCAEITKIHHDVVFSRDDSNLECAEIQRKAFGHSTELNLLRSRLTVCAFELHQAWLVASYKSGFAQTINQLPNLLLGDISSNANAKIMWQCLFMVCPVVSSAFASVASQFSALGQGDIGWLFIDESGQATPSQAVGALLRAKNAVVVGDPLQIEPVFTTPPDIVEYLGERILQDDWHTWSPSVTSVQELADRANPFGTDQIAIGKWLGSPLRVHRRCSDPMFSISNQIAYNNKMIHGSNSFIEEDQFVWGPSSWFDIKGYEEGKHYVPEQAQHVLKMLYTFIDCHAELPDCYIISPFTKVKLGVGNYLKNHFKHSDINQSDFNDWLQGRIGTVHTFQGKEEKLVIFVLGASESIGAANWAASKPNLLNVAVTRAKKRVYLIGCYEQWSGLPYFADAFSFLNKEITNEKIITKELEEVY